MLPIERLQKSIGAGNLWVYLIFIAKNQEIAIEDAPRLIFEQFGFMPGAFLASRVLFSLKRNGFISSEKHLGRKAYRAAQKGIDQLELAKAVCEQLAEKLSK